MPTDPRLELARLVQAMRDIDAALLVSDTELDRIEALKANEAELRAQNRQLVREREALKEEAAQLLGKLDMTLPRNET